MHEVAIQGIQWNSRYSAHFSWFNETRDDLVGYGSDELEAVLKLYEKASKYDSWNEGDTLELGSIDCAPGILRHDQDIRVAYNRLLYQRVKENETPDGDAKNALNPEAYAGIQTPYRYTSQRESDYLRGYLHGHCDGYTNGINSVEEAEAKALSELESDLDILKDP